MLRIVCDTNVIVSGLIAQSGHPYEILAAWQNGDIVLLMSPEILKEVTDVLGRPFFRDKRGITEERRVRVQRLLEIDAVHVEISSCLDVVADDLTDNHIVECAVDGGADYLVSGDQHLLRLGRYEHIPIVTARELAAILAVQRPAN